MENYKCFTCLRVIFSHFRRFSQRAWKSRERKRRNERESENSYSHFVFLDFAFCYQWKLFSKSYIFDVIMLHHRFFARDFFMNKLFVVFLENILQIIQELI